MPAMWPSDSIVWGQRQNGTDGACFLAHAVMRRTVYQARKSHLTDRLLERADKMQLGKHSGEEPWVRSLPVSFGASKLDPARSVIQWNKFRHAWDSRRCVFVGSMRARGRSPTRRRLAEVDKVAATEALLPAKDRAAFDPAFDPLNCD